ncbi:hypothetical protein SUGI_0786450 [Cryptomeria japonica]|nr:hypothetical protein SUGI_0786450 [Cryptomeria japonica]
MGNSGGAQFLALLSKLSVVLFIAAVILILFLFSLCIRLFNRRNSTTFHSHRAGRNHSAEENPSVVDMPVGLQREVIETLPTFEYEAEQMNILLPCPVCLSEFQENEKGRVLPNCNHRFHIDCIDKWLCSNSTCPVCRAKIEGFSPGKRTELGVGDQGLRGVSGCGHDSKGESSSSLTDMDEAKPLPETAIDISV